ncbi:MAG TPA: nucleotide exchange factor GrpE [Gemmatimonadetes bacterium]|nr:nucleotide exchange factor GrpE [Gemmatimonadota bacterium]|tara:strand:+ start:441 stop:1109 length:669 start_codon:yes stop_codon:yes gene_type:complete
MGKKKTSPPEETTTSAVEAPEQGDGASSETASGDPVSSEAFSGDPESTGAPQGDGASTEEFEAGGGDGKPSTDIEDMQAELTTIKDRHLRLVAEFTNYRRRAEGELSEAWGRGQADMLRSFVDGLDDLQRVGAWQAESTTVEALIEGVDLVERKFRQALEASGVELIDPVGEAFDPNLMEAMLGVPTENPEDDQKVQEVFQKGYLFKGNLVRPARVVVFKHG